MKWMSQGFVGRTVGQTSLTVGLFAAVWLVYYPSLDHAPRADQWCFLLDTTGQEDFSTLFAHTYSYNRTRMVCPGDYHLFRPVLFGLLSGEKALFGNRFALWQATGITLHCLALFLLLRLLLRLNVLLNKTGTEGPPRWFSSRSLTNALTYALVLYFGLNCAIVEMVIWAHINGYLLFVVLMLGSILLLLEGIALPVEARTKRVCLLGSAWFLTLLSAFTYEIGQFYAVIAGTVLAVALYRKSQARKCAFIFAVFFSILVLYRLANFVDQRVHNQRGPDLPIVSILEKIASSTTISHAVRYMLYDLFQPFFPTWVGWTFGSRLVIPEAMTTRWKDLTTSPMPIVSYFLLVGMMGLTLRGVWRLRSSEQKRLGLTVALLGFSLIVLHLGITVVGRMNLRPGPDVLSTNSYYAYLPFLFLLLSVAAFWQREGTTEIGRGMLLRNSLSIGMISALLVLSIVSGVEVYHINVKGRENFEGFTHRIARIDKFVRQHCDEDDFSLAFTFDSCRAVGTQYGVPITTMLFQPYINVSRPKYVVGFSDGEPTVSTYEQWQETRNASCRLCPELVSVGSSYMYYHFEGKYYGVLHWDGCYDPARHDHAYLIEGATLAEARSQQRAKLDLQDADIRSGRFIPPGSSVALVEEGYKGFNLIECAGRIYAIPQGEGAFDPVRIREHGYSSSHVGGSTIEVKAQIGSEESAEPRP